jgi:hypothetical protein
MMRFAAAETPATTGIPYRKDAYNSGNIISSKNASNKGDSMPATIGK